MRVDEDFEEFWRDVRGPPLLRVRITVPPEPAVEPGVVWAALMCDQKEVEGYGYARQRIEVSTLRTGRQVRFGPTGADSWGPVTNVALFDRSAYGKKLYWSEPTSPIHPSNYMTFEITIQVHLPIGPGSERTTELLRFVLGV